MTTLLKLVLTLTLASSLLIAGHPQTDKLINLAKKQAGEMTAKTLKKMLDDEKEVIILDVRESVQRAEGEIYADDTFAITRGNLEFKVLNLIRNKDAVIVTYCRSGGRGALAALSLRTLGYKNATNLKGGLKAWAKEGYPVETGLGVVRLSKED